MKKSSLIILFALLHYSGVCQVNLVKNNSFEQNLLTTGVSPGIKHIADWFGANAGYGDYYTRNSELKDAGVPNNIFGHQEPHSGEAYTGICIEKDFAEYIETNLKEPLKKGVTYTVSFFISRADKRKDFVRSFGVLFLPKEKRHFFVAGIDQKPQIEFVDPNGYRDSENWTQLLLPYTADGNECSMVIGHFFGKEEKFRGKSHYYIDDVSVTSTEPKKNNTMNTMAYKAETDMAMDTVTLSHVVFETGKSQLIENSVDYLKKNLLHLKQRDCSLKIIGHTDTDGDEKSNLTLSTARARAVYDFLIENGFAADRLTYLGEGSRYPVSDNSTEAGKQKNRRVEIIIYTNQ